MIEKYKREPDEDFLDRKGTIENLSNLVMSTKESLVMSINADWGAGKTTFVKLWQKHLITQGVHSIYFSAWEDDFSKEPLISILGEINSYINQHFGKKDKDTTYKLDAVKNMGGKILRRGVPAALKGLTGGVLDFDKSIEDAIGAMAEQTAKELIERYSQEKEITQKFREAIKTLLEKIDKDKPFIIFIDELDRCRPLYAIELLERVKHIFGIEGLVFVLSIDKTQLAESIKSQYGNIDTNNYLRRFIDLEFTLQNPSIDKFCEGLYQKYTIETILQNKNIQSTLTRMDDKEILKYLALEWHLTLREIEHLFIRLGVFCKTLGQGASRLDVMIFIFFTSLKIKDQHAYIDLIESGKIDTKIETLQFNNDILLRNIVDLIKRGQWKDKKAYETFLSNQEALRHKIYKSVAQEEGHYTNIDLNDRTNFCSILNQKFDDTIKKLLQKIEFVDKFTLE